MVREVSIRECRWRVHATSLPRVARRCPRCDAPRGFVSSRRFRVNASGRRLDVWLVHRCEVRDETWNAEVLARVTPEEVGPALPDYERNDAGVARRRAFAVAGADRAVAYRVERSPVEPGVTTLVVVELVDAVDVRVDRLLAGELGLSRPEVARRLDDGRLRCDPPRRRVMDGQVLWIRA